MTGMKEDASKVEGSETIKPVINAIIGTIQVAGTGIALIMVSVLGIKYMLAAPNDKADVKVEIEASYKKREYFDFNDGIYLVVHLFFIFVSSILAFKYSDNSDIFPLSVTTAISLSISAIITTSIKLFGKRKIRIDDFTQWMKPSSEGEREMQELIKTRKLNTPKT